MRVVVCVGAWDYGCKRASTNGQITLTIPTVGSPVGNSVAGNVCLQERTSDVIRGFRVAPQ